MGTIGNTMRFWSTRCWAQAWKCQWRIQGCCSKSWTPQPLGLHGLLKIREPGPSQSKPYGYGSIPIKIPFLVGWTSINPSYFDVNYRGTRFWHTAICFFSISLFFGEGVCVFSCFLRGVLDLYSCWQRHEELRIGDIGIDVFSPTAWWVT